MRRVYFGALLALMVAVAGGAFCNGLFFIGRPYQLNYGEGLVVWQAARVTDLTRAFAPIDRYPFVAFQYPPLFHLAMRALATMTPDLLVAGRTASLLSAALICILAGGITFSALPRRTGWYRRMFAAAFAAALPATLYNFPWAWLARVDTLAVLLSFCGVAIFAVRPGSKTIELLASVMMTAGLFTRQTALAAPLACLLVAFLMDRRVALRMLLMMGLLGGSILGWLALRTHGQVFLHLFRYNQNPFSISRALLGFLMNARHVAGLLLLAGGASLGVLESAWALIRRGRWQLLSSNLRANACRRKVLLLAVYGILAGISALAFGKQGSDVNYFLELNISLAPLAGILLFRAMPPAGSLAPARPVLLAALTVPLLLLGVGLDQARDGWLRAFRGPLAADQEQMNVYLQMLAVVRQTPGEVLSEDMTLLYKTGKNVPAELSVLEPLAHAGMWDERPFVQMIRNRRFALVVTNGLSYGERYSPAVAGAIEQAYESTAPIGDYRIYRPRAGQ